jgi:hypothetical protein
MGVNGYLCMVYTCYLDDSKDQNQSKIVVSAGFYGTKDDWVKLRVAWKKRLKEDGLDYFKTSEYKSLTGEFSKFRTAAYPPPKGREKAMQIRSDLKQIFKRIPGIQGVGVVIPLDDYGRVCERPEAQDVFVADPYRRALEGVLLDAVKLIRQKSGQNVVAFVHDDDQDFDRLRQIYNEFKILNPKTAKFMAGFQSLDDKLHPPLQMADMMANLTLGVGLEWLETGRTPSKLKEMEENIRFIGAWNEHYMLSLLKLNLIANGRPVPADLQADEYG